jgi:hypothetical protein
MMVKDTIIQNKLTALAGLADESERATSIHSFIKSVEWDIL